MIEGAIFDWAGTTIDFGCMAPVASFRQAFKEYKIHVRDVEIRKPVGMLKIDHIKAMLGMPRIYDAFIEVYGRSYQEEDIQRIYQIYEYHLLKNLTKFTDIKPYVLEVMKELRVMGIKIGSTTDYTDVMMEAVVQGAAEKGYTPDAWFSPDSICGKGRPYPYMIYKNMEALGLSDVRNIIKVGDTISDIKEGLHAGVYTIGVIEGSSLMGFAYDEYASLDDETRLQAIKTCEEAYREAGAHACILHMGELPDFIKKKNKEL